MLKRITQARIGLRLPALIIGLVIVAVVAMSLIFTQRLKQTLTLEVENRTELIAESVSATLEGWAQRASDRFDFIALAPEASEALKRLGQSLAEKSPSEVDAIWNAYGQANPFPAGQHMELDRAEDGSTYSLFHASTHPHFRELADRGGFYDLFLIDPNGLIIYSVAKESDFGSNLLTGPLADSGLAEVFRTALEDPEGETHFSDFAKYAPSNNEPAAFLARRLLDANGEVVGVVAVQLAIDRITAVMEVAEGVHDSDEIYLIGADGLSRTTSRQDGLFEILDPVPQTAQLDLVRSETPGFLAHTPGVRGADVAAFVEKVDFMGRSWWIVAELDAEVAYAALTRQIKESGLTVAFGIIVALVAGFLVARSITTPIAQFSGSMSKVSEGDYETAIYGVDRLDEIGGLSRILDGFRSSLAQMRVADERQAAARAEQARVVDVLGQSLHALATGNLGSRIDEEFPEDYEALRRNFNATTDALGELVTAIVSNAGEIRTRAEEISMSSDSLSHRTESQAATLEETAAALDELTASVRSAADSASEVERVVHDARTHAEKSGRVVADAVSAMSLIKKSSDEISQIIGVIDDIAFQTNLLALNAGVEAARAGDAGRGFAVVASEVRALAQRSSDAAKQIKTLIGGSTEQVETGVGLVGNAGEALTSIVSQVTQIANLVSNIATGAREQSSGLGEINIGVTQLDQVTQQNAAMVEEATAASASLRSEAEALNSLVAHFKLDSVADEARVVTMKRVPPKEVRKAAHDANRPAKIASAAGSAGQWKDF
jgi:methyl-accepting chemotaxis protein